MTSLKKSDFYFDLPEELIAQDPLEDRSASRLLMLQKETGEIKHEIFIFRAEFINFAICPKRCVNDPFNAHSCHP